MTTHPKPARVDLGDGDSLILFRTDDWHTTVRFHSANPNTSLAGAVMATDALRDALDEIAPVQEASPSSGLAAHFRDKRDMERARAEKAEQERDEAVERAAIASPRPLTADDIPTQEFEAMSDRALARWDDARTVWAPRDAMREAMRAALTPPSVTLESIVDEALDKYTGGYLNGDEVGPYVASKYADLTDGSN